MRDTEQHVPAQAPRLRIEMLHGPAWSDDFVAAWSALAEDRGTANIFYEPWAALPASMLPEAAGIMILAAWHDLPDGSARLDGILPLQRRRVAKGRLIVAVQNWDQRVRALGEPLIRAGAEAAFWSAALTALDAARGLGGYLRLSTLIADSASTRALTAELSARGRRYDVTRRHARALLNGGVDAATYIAGNIRKKVLKEQRRLRNRLADQGPLVFDRLAAGDDVTPWIDELFRLEMTGWKGRDGVAAAADAATERCFRDLLMQAHALGRLDFHRMRVGDAVLSLLAVIVSGDTAFQLKIAYDEDHAAFSPGVLLEMAYLEHALAPGGPARVDSCARAGHPMIDRIWVDRLPIVSLAIPFDRLSSRAIVAAQRFVRRARTRRARPVPPSDMQEQLA